MTKQEEIRYYYFTWEMATFGWYRLCWNVYGDNSICCHQREWFS